jgi:hypothetical protein
MKKLLAFLFSALLVTAHATSVDLISSNVNGMRQLTAANIVQRGPGIAPYYGPSSCAQELPGYEANMGAGYTCSCPNGASTPVCTPDCSALLASYQQKAGQLYSCTCPAPNQVPACAQLNCGGLLSAYAAEFPSPQYSCSCPSGASAAVAPTCQSTQTCQSQLSHASATAGANYSCSCASCSGPNDPNCYVQPSCVYVPPTCGDQLSQFQAQYGSNFVCTCPNGTGSIDSPVCTQTCGSQLASYQAQYGTSYTCTCPNGPDAAATPTCTAVPTCGDMLASYQSQYGSGYTCSCPSGNSSTSSPSCTASCQPVWWTDVFMGSGQYQQYVYPIEYFNAISFKSGHVIQPVDVSGEGWGSGQPVTVTSANGWAFDRYTGMDTATDGAYFVPLYPSASDYSSATHVSGWVTIVNNQTQYCNYNSGMCSTTGMYYYVANGSGMNPSVTINGQPLSINGPAGTNPSLQSADCYHNYTSSTCFKDTTQTPQFTTPVTPACP